MATPGVTKHNDGIFAPTFTIEVVAGRSVKLEDCQGKVSD